MGQLYSLCTTTVGCGRGRGHAHALPHRTWLPGHDQEAPHKQVGKGALTRPSLKRKEQQLFQVPGWAECSAVIIVLIQSALL